MKNNSVKMFVGICAAFLMIACGGAKNVPSNSTAVANGPAWIDQGSAAFNDGCFYGVGIATGIKNRALAVDAADSRARAKVAEILKTEITKLMKDYMSSTTAGDMTQSSEEQDVTSAIKSFTQVELSGAIIVDHWKDPTDGSMFALAKLDLAAVQKTLDQAKELSPKVRDFVKANAQKAFDDLNAESEKHAQ